MEPGLFAKTFRRPTVNVVMKRLRFLLAVLMPPWSVFLSRGTGRTFWINVVLTLLAYVPGVVHALWIVKRR